VFKIIIFFIINSLFVNQSFATSYDKTFEEAAISDIRVLKMALELFKSDTGRYPSISEGLDILVDKEAGKNIKGYHEKGYLKKTEIPKDPWGFKYHYSIDHDKDSKEVIEVWSTGKDGKPGGWWKNSDIYYKE
jgi:general secretion pathway protein G